MGMVINRFECINTHKFTFRMETPILVSDYASKLSSLVCPYCKDPVVYVGNRT